MNKILFPENERGSVNHGWLNAKHSFSFGSYYNPDKVHFGALRVLNDDRIAAGMGFGRHPHDNMEIITIPLSGSLAHKDSMGNHGIIEAGEVQVMSAGKGIEHSEVNHLKNEELKLFQIWIMPNQKDVEPRYDQIKIPDFNKENSIIELVCPKPETNKTWIHQDAWLSIANIASDNSVEYKLHGEQNGVYIMNIEGEAEIENEILKQRDAIGLSQLTSTSINAKTKSRILIIEVPMNF